MSRLELKTKCVRPRLEQSTAASDLFSGNKAGFFRRIGPSVASQMTSALQGLTHENINVEFGDVRNLEGDEILLDTGQKCFGSSVNFKCPEVRLAGIAVMFLPVSSAKVLTELLLKCYLRRSDRKETAPELRLSAFREAMSILLSTHTTSIANILRIKLQTSVPKLIRFRNVKFSKPAVFERFANMDSVISVGKFCISDQRVKAPEKNTTCRLAGASLMLIESSGT